MEEVWAERRARSRLRIRSAAADVEEGDLRVERGVVRRGEAAMVAVCF